VISGTAASSSKRSLVPTSYSEAALVSVPRSVEDPIGTNDVNVGGTLSVLSAAREKGVRRVVLASSSAVYGDSPDTPKREDMTPNPLSPYAATKYISEIYAKMYNDVYGLETACLRYFNVYGPRQSPHSEYAAVIPKFICSVLDGVSPVIFGDGNQTRDFIYIDDVVEANWAAADMPGARGRNINIGCGQEHSVNELVALLKEVFGTDMRPEYRPPRKGDLVHSVASVEKLEQMLHCAPRVSLKEGLARTAEWFRKKRHP
jgi:nucleoside-diphosphate-sugar epimerase